MKEVNHFVNGPLLGDQKNAIYKETTTPALQVVPCKSRCSSQFFSRLGLSATITAIVICIAIIIVLLTNGMRASNSRELAQEEEIGKLREKLEAQQSRLHRMQKELQFLVTRQKTYEAREESKKRGSITDNGLTFKLPMVANFKDEKMAVQQPEITDSSMSESYLETGEEEIDVDKLPRASPNKRQGFDKLNQ